MSAGTISTANGGFSRFNCFRLLPPAIQQGIIDRGAMGKWTDDQEVTDARSIGYAFSMAIASGRFDMAGEILNGTVGHPGIKGVFATQIGSGTNAGSWPKPETRLQDRALGIAWWLSGVVPGLALNRVPGSMAYLGPVALATDFVQKHLSALDNLIDTSTNWTMVCASALIISGQYVGSATTVNLGQRYLALSLARQWDDGTFIEEGGFDTTYQAVSIRFLALIRMVSDSTSCAIAFQSAANRWLQAFVVDPEDSSKFLLDVRHATRTGKGYKIANDILELAQAFAFIIELAPGSGAYIDGTWRGVREIFEGFMAAGVTGSQVNDFQKYALYTPDPISSDFRNEVTSGHRNYHPIVQTWVTNMGGTTSSGMGSVSPQALAAAERFVQSIDTLGLWPKIGRLNLMCGRTLDSTVVPLKFKGTYSADLKNSFAETNYWELTGIQGLKDYRHWDTQVKPEDYGGMLLALPRLAGGLVLMGSDVDSNGFRLQRFEVSTGVYELQGMWGGNKKAVRSFPPSANTERNSVYFVQRSDDGTHYTIDMYSIYIDSAGAPVPNVVHSSVGDHVAVTGAVDIQVLANGTDTSPFFEKGSSIPAWGYGLLNESIVQSEAESIAQEIRQFNMDIGRTEGPTIEPETRLLKDAILFRRAFVSDMEIYWFNEFIVAMKSGVNALATKTFLCPFLGDRLASALVALYRDPVAGWKVVDMTKMGSGPLSFSTYDGIAGDGTSSYVDTNIPPTGILHLGAYLTKVPTQKLATTIGSASVTALYRTSGTKIMGVHVENNTAFAQWKEAVPGVLPGNYLGIKIDSPANLRIYKNNATQDPVAATIPPTTPTANIALLARGGTSVGLFDDATLGFASGGTAMTTAQIAQDDAATRGLMKRLGRLTG